MGAQRGFADFILISMYLIFLVWTVDSQFLVKFHEKPGVVAGKLRGAWLGLGPILQSGIEM